MSYFIWSLYYICMMLLFYMIFVLFYLCPPAFVMVCLYLFFCFFLFGLVLCFCKIFKLEHIYLFKCRRWNSKLETGRKSMQKQNIHQAKVGWTALWAKFPRNFLSAKRSLLGLKNLVNIFVTFMYFSLLFMESRYHYEGILGCFLSFFAELTSEVMKMEICDYFLSLNDHAKIYS